MTKNLDFLSENLASRGAKTDFLLFVVRELLTFEFVVSNRSPLGPLIKKFCLVRIGLICIKVGRPMRWKGLLLPWLRYGKRT